MHHEQRASNVHPKHLMLCERRSIPHLHQYKWPSGKNPNAQLQQAFAIVDEEVVLLFFFVVVVDEVLSTVPVL
jgi:hypothetical protein